LNKPTVWFTNKYYNFTTIYYQFTIFY
jgi:hypothetical protein